MTEAQKQKLEAQLWKVANELRGKMDADAHVAAHCPEGCYMIDAGPTFVTHQITRLPVSLCIQWQRRIFFGTS